VEGWLAETRSGSRSEHTNALAGSSTQRILYGEVYFDDFDKILTDAGLDSGPETSNGESEFRCQVRLSC
jgi:hypothetical protein